MNILKRELKSGLKPFIFWTIGLFVLVFAGMTKYTGVESSGGSINLNGLLDKFPRVVLAVMGMVGIDINSLGGYYSILVYYALICAVIYAIHLGSNAVNRESVDKTYEFIFTKPLSRSYILRMKLIAAWIYLTVICILNYLFSVSAVATLKFTENLNFQMFLFTAMIFIVSSVFLSLSAFISAAVKSADKGSFYGNLCFLYAFIMGIVYDMLENGGALKLFSPLKYFSSADLLNKILDPLFAAICLFLICVFLCAAFIKFKKKDLTA